MNRSKAKGTAGESAVVKYLRENGFPRAERRALTGSADKGDVSGVPAVIEVKNSARDKMPAWVREAETEKENAGEEFGVVWAKARGTTDPGKWFVTMTGEQWVQIMRILAARQGGAR